MFEEVTHPAHYAGNAGVECIEAIESALTPEEFRGYLRGNLIKYAWRCEDKGGAADLGKAGVYLGWLSAALEAAGAELEREAESPTLYRFGRNLRAAACSDYEQSAKAFEEVGESFRAMAGGESPFRVCEETWDGIQALEGILRHYPYETVQDAYDEVVRKSAERGDYR